MTFADSAARLAGVAGAVLSWRPDEFWRATPGELAVIFAALGRGGGGETPADGDDFARLRGMYPDG